MKIKKNNSNLLFLLLIIGVSIFVNGCSKDTNTPNEDPNTSNLLPNEFIDQDNNHFFSVTIGNQIWMDSNLKTSKYRNGDLIPNITDNTEWINLSTGAYCNYENWADDVVPDLGKLYNWYAVNDNRNIAPKGWHVATDSDWMILINYLGGEIIAGGKLKYYNYYNTADITNWISPNFGASNSSNFSALPGGARYTNFEYFLSAGFWWSSTENNLISSWARSLSFDHQSVDRLGAYKVIGMSVRCVKD